MKILANENIFPLGDYSCHASHFVLLPDGAIFAVWFQGSAEGNDDVCIWGARRENGTWSEEVRLTADDGQPHWNPVLHRLPDGRVRLFYKAGKPIAAWHTEYMDSFDGCRTFSAPRELVPGDVSGGRGPVRNKIIELSDGSLLAPGSTEGGGWRCFTDRSEDGGRTWTRSADFALSDGDLRPDVPPDEHQRGIIQPTLWEHPDEPGHVTAFVRSTEGRIFRSESRDFGRSWSVPVRTELKNNNSGIDLCTLPDGRILLACNPRSVPDGKIWGKRTPLSLFVSADGGESFEKLTDVATGAGVFAYPAVRYADGVIHLTYTWNRRLIMYFAIQL